MEAKLNMLKSGIFHIALARSYPMKWDGSKKLISICFIVSHNNILCVCVCVGSLIIRQKHSDT